MFDFGPIGVLGTRMFIGSNPLINAVNAADELSDFLARENVEIGSIEVLGNFGIDYEDVGFQDIRDGRNFREKGGFDPGTFLLTVALDLTDPGQTLLSEIADSFTNDIYPVKLLFLDADPSVAAVYFGVKVISFEVETGTVRNWVKAAITLAINTEIFYGADEASGFFDDNGLLCLLDDTGWPTTPAGTPGSFWSNGGVVSVVPGGTYVLGEPVFFGEIDSDDLLALGGLGLPTTHPEAAGQLWVSFGEVWVA